MTGGTVVVLGQTGCNFAAGMSGGLAYVLDEMQLFDTLCNLDMVELEPVWQEMDKAVLYELIERHLEWTGSERAKYVLRAWPDMVGRFVKVIPIDIARRWSGCRPSSIATRKPPRRPRFFVGTARRLAGLKGTIGPNPGSGSPKCKRCSRR
jgi:glutamate synthase domain-containing protein 3